ncbi:MAG: hypothetical protein K0S65_5066 [Labilithrix sp.]|nr:hypothetical protein [Labilithrix sp.]
MTRRKVVAFALPTVLALAGVIAATRLSKEDAPCGAGFKRAGPRCMPPSSNACPPPLVSTEHGCDAPERDVVEVPATTILVGPSDWEAEGRVVPRTARVPAFAIDRLEVTTGRACAHVNAVPRCDASDPARAASGVSFEHARAFCKSHGGRLPTDDEWLAAAGGDKPRRYPWGDTGAVCRRAAWGLESGPCGEGGSGPDTVGAHPEGATPLGIHDLAGNVAEWVEAPCSEPEKTRGCPAVRGGSWRTRLATELRTWLRHDATAASVAGGDPTIGFRCAYDRP